MFPNETSEYMIVNYTAAGWQVITQRSHGLLSGQICGQWKVAMQPERWVDTLIAAAEHDDVYNEMENDDILNANGGPVDFKMCSFRKDYAQLMMERSLSKSTYIALLTLKHMQFVHGADPAAKTYFSSLQNEQKKWRKVAGVTGREIDKAYDLLEFCDAFSLLICQGLLQPEGRKMEISSGPDGKVYQVYESGPQHLKVAPWPFETEIFTLRFESRTIEQLSFRNIAEFRKALNAAEIVGHELTVSRS